MGSALSHAFASTWVVGQVSSLSGAAAKQGLAYAQGMQLYFDQVNRSGGLQRRAIELVVIDDRGQPSDTVEKTRELLRDKKPLVLAGFQGNRNLRALVDSKLLDGAQVPVVGYQGTDTSLSGAPLFFGTRAGLREQIAKIASHMAVIGERQVALVHDERVDATELTNLVNNTLVASGAQLVMAHGLGTGRKSEVDAAVAALYKHNAKLHSVLMVTSSPVTASFVEAYRMDGGRAQLYALAEADAEQLATRLPTQYMSGLSIAQVVPNPYKNSLQLSRELNDTIASNQQAGKKAVSFTMMEGYVNAKVIVEAMRHAKPLTPEKLTQVLRYMDNLDVGGYWISYPAGSQVGSKYVDLSMINAYGRITQ
ncbi:MAG: ABC transporter substrate-binding protein [Comamonas sp.]